VFEVRYVWEHDGVFVMPLVVSSAIQSIEFDELTNTLQITFTSGKTYTYYAVPRSIYERFLNAPSKGTFFNEYIKDRYSFA
jgi:KTSC domain